MAFVNAITGELIQGVVGQEVIYYQVLAEKTKTNDLYNEAVNKVFANPVKVHALVYYENSTQTVTNFPADSKFNVDVHFHNNQLDAQNLAPKMGDFVQFGEVMYEIYTVTQPQMAFGMINQRVMTKCSCGPARQGQLSVAKQTTPAQPSPGIDTLAPKYSEQPPYSPLKGYRR